MVNPRTSDRGRSIPSLSGGSAPSMRSSHSDGVDIFTPRSHAGSTAVVNERDLSDLISRFRSLSTSATDKLVRPGFGTRGASTSLRSNLFQLNYPSNVILYDYTIKIQPALGAEDGDLRRHIVTLFANSKELGPFLQGIALDGAGRLVAKKPLPEGFSIKVVTHVNGGNTTRAGEIMYMVGLAGPRELKSADLARFLRGEDPKINPAPILSAFNLIISAHAARSGVRASGKHAYYFEPDQVDGTRAGIATVNGFFATVRPVYKSLMVNVNACMSAFYVPTERLSDAMVSFNHQSHGSMHPNKFFGKIRVTTTYLGYARRSNIKGFGSDSAKKTIFRSEELGKVTVEKYFQKKYGITLQHAEDLPVVNIGSGDNDVFVPAELCKIERGSLFTGELTRHESAALCRANCRAPAGDAQTITIKGLRLLGFEANTAPLASFGIKISLDMAVISARVLPAPKVLCQSGQLAVIDGSWTTRGIQFAKPAKVSRLGVLILQDTGSEGCLTNPEAELRGPLGALFAKCHSCGMSIDSKPEVRVVDLPRAVADDDYRGTAISKVRKAVDSLPGKPQMVIALVSNKDRHVFAGLRKLFDTQLGCQLIVALIPNICEKDGQDQYLMNLALKFNAKMGGINHTLDPSSLKWLHNSMVVGMDVTHPGEGCIEGTPSIAAVSASCDMNFVHYPASVRVQEGKKQTISYVGQMMIERLKDYRQRMRSFPERIVIFRSGISRDFAEKVMKAEINDIKKAFSELADYRPAITYIICGKGHNIRFYPTKVEDADKTSNSKAGTVVDQGVTGIYDFDFYLQAHAATQGMVRATRYTVVHDENKFTPDVLQQGINDLSYLWALASKSVSLVPPAYWADRACKRARLYLHKILPPVEGSKESKISKKEIKDKAKGLWGDGVHDDLKGTMFFL